MADDIVTRLRQKYAGQLPICTEAADEIERLRDERDDWLNAAVAYKIGWASRGNKIYDRLVNGMENHE